MKYMGYMKNTKRPYGKIEFSFGTITSETGEKAKWRIEKNGEKYIFSIFEKACFELSEAQVIKFIEK